jgi:hypothetical protein
VRGRLGPLKVYVTPGTHRNKNEDADAWREVYAGEHACSFGALVELALAEPVVLAPGGSCGLYVHSSLRGDEALVYDNQRAVATHEDLYVRARLARPTVTRRVVLRRPVPDATRHILLRARAVVGLGERWLAVIRQTAMNQGLPSPDS